MTTTTIRVIAPPEWAARIMFAIEMVDPDKATFYLEKNVLNRDISQSHVEWLARLMRDDQWGLSDSAICFSELGCVLNGQHRLWAVIMSGKTVPMLVGRGYPENSQRIMDTGRRRNVRDTAKVEGMKNVKTWHVAMARTMMSLGSGFNIRFVSNIDATDYLKVVFPAIQFVSDQVITRSTRGFHHSGLGSVIAQAWFTQDHDSLIEFGRVLTSGEPEREPGSRVVAMLRDFMQKPGLSQKLSTPAVYRRTQFALSVFLQNVQARYLEEERDQLFPIPNSFFEEKKK